MMATLCEAHAADAAATDLHDLADAHAADLDALAQLHAATSDGEVKRSRLANTQVVLTASGFIDTVCHCARHSLPRQIASMTAQRAWHLLALHEQGALSKEACAQPIDWMRPARPTRVYIKFSEPVPRARARVRTASSTSCARRSTAPS